MKFSIALCLLLAAGCSAHMSFKDLALEPFVGLQEKAMRSLISAHAASDDPNLINACFGQYIIDQQTTMANYNKVYSTCVNTAQVAKDKVTEQSNAQRKDLLKRSDNMCDTLSSCEKQNDGLKFFDCYRNASADSYKVMFTLNSDANTQFNTVNAAYSAIDSTNKNCVDEARLEYARELEKCDNDFNICVGTDVPTDQPTTTAKPTDSPVTVTDAPSTEAPSTEAPSTEAPSTEAPSTEAPSTEAPSTEAPSTEAPSTEAPSTEAPSTEAPSTEAPSTEAPSTEAPSTEAPSTEAPSTEAPSTEAPSTEAPSTEAPSTEAPSTEAPSTEAPSTEAPSTEAPASEEPATRGPTQAPEPTTEKSPEEDLKFLPLTFKSKLQKLMKFF
ncbi:hyphally regulated cell wall protein 3 isoform X2 [Drosophila innubila]|uniref:hyphally regulated cell wall protein 3 isoform X2 n=1 Tax=Drosophila innubila TaxID=198719 RepID=UPI00148C208F|nr:hyphally regulated cell wall protein 3 isoform X2 [Drosophila innubila]